MIVGGIQSAEVLVTGDSVDTSEEGLKQDNVVLLVHPDSRRYGGSGLESLIAESSFGW